MKLKVNFYKNWVNAHHKYRIRGYDQHLPYAVDVAVIWCSLFCAIAVLIVLKSAIKIKLEISKEWT